jgi:hypothetical protein
MFLRNDCRFLKDYTALQPRRHNSSMWILSVGNATTYGLNADVSGVLPPSSRQSDYQSVRIDMVQRSKGGGLLHFIRRVMRSNRQNIKHWPCTTPH